MIDIWIKVSNIGFFYSACETRAFYSEIARNTYILSHFYCELLRLWRTSVQRKEHSLQIVNPPLFASRLTYFLRNWRCITLDPEILDMVGGSYKLELKAPLLFSSTESWKIDAGITDILTKGALKK